MNSWFSPALQTEMPVTTYGDYGFTLLFVPHRRSRLFGSMNASDDGNTGAVYPMAEEEVNVLDQQHQQ